MAAQILLIDDDPAAQRLATFALRQAGHTVVSATSDSAAATVVKAAKHDLVVLDAADTEEAWAILARIRTTWRRGRHVPVIFVTGRDRGEDRIRALRSGADDTLAKPYHPADLVAHVRSVLVRFRPEVLGPSVVSLGKVIAFYGVKGGVGNTTLAVNTAVALQRQLGRQVALVDASLQYGDIRVFLDMGVDQKTIVDVVSAPAVDADVVRNTLVRDDTGVDVLLAPLSPGAAELVTEHHIPEVLRAMRPMYQFVIVDVGHRLDDISLRAMDAADVVVTVMTPDLPSLKNARAFLDTMQHLGVPSDKVKLVLNRSTASTGIKAASIENALERAIDHQVVNEFNRAMTALNSGTPFMVKRADSRLGRSVLALATALETTAANAAERTGVLPT